MLADAVTFALWILGIWGMFRLFMHGRVQDRKVAEWKEKFPLLWEQAAEVGFWRGMLTRRAQTFLRLLANPENSDPDTAESVRRLEAAMVAPWLAFSVGMGGLVFLGKF